MSDAPVVGFVAARGLCSGCGVCAGACPRSALKMGTSKLGDPEPVNVGVCPEGCKVCAAVCPFITGCYNPRDSNTELFATQLGSTPVFHPAVGWHLRCLVGYRNHAALRLASASGGLATWLLETLLARQLVDKIAVVRPKPGSDCLRFESGSASTVEELRAAVGSVYHPVEISAVVRQILADSRTRWALIGVPCLCAAIRSEPHLQSRVRYVLGLACGMYQNTMYTEFLLSASGLCPGEAVSVSYRRKRLTSPASNFEFVATDKTGRTGRSLPYHGIPFFLGRNAYFRLQACDFCTDVFAEVADACFMDAWLREYVGDPKGTSLVVVRNSTILGLFESGGAGAEITVQPIGADRVAQSQSGQIRRKQELIGMRTNSVGAASYRPPTVLERVDWRLQRRTRARSKLMWRSFGRKHGRLTFWLAMADLLIAQVTLHSLLPKLRRALRAARALRSKRPKT